MPVRSHSSTGWQIAFGAIMTMAMVTATFIPFILGTLGPFIVDDLGISRTRLGFLITTAFVMATIFSPIAGRVADSRRGRALLLIVFGLSAAALIGMVFAPTYGWMLAAVGLAGISQAGSNPATNKMISAYGVEGYRGVLVGVKQSGVPAGGLLAGSLLPLGAALWGWRDVLAMTAMLPAISLLIAHKIVPDTWPSGEEGSQSRRIRFEAEVMWLMAYAFLMGGGVAAVTAYLPLYAHQSLGTSEATAGLFIAAIGITGIASRIAWAHLSDRLHDLSVVLTWFALVATLMLGVIWAAQALGSWALWVGSLGLGASAVAWNSVAMLAIVKEIGFDSAGAVSGLVLVGFFGGFIMSPSLFGFLVDVTGAYHLSWAFAAAQFLAAIVPARAWKSARVQASGAC